MKPRIRTSFRALVRCPLAGDRKSTEETLVENISANGLYLRLRAPVDPGSTLFALLFVPASDSDPASCAKIAVRATVVRADQLTNGAQGLGVRLTRYRFI